VNVQHCAIQYQKVSSKADPLSLNDHFNDHALFWASMLDLNSQILKKWCAVTRICWELMHYSPFPIKLKNDQKVTRKIKSKINISFVNQKSDTSA